MAEKVPNSNKSVQLRRLVAQERTLVQEKAALEQMLKNVQALRNKLKVEQIQLSSHLQAELGGETLVEVPAKSLHNQDYRNAEEEENSIVVNKPTLNLNVDNYQRMFFGRDDDGEEDDEDDSENEFGCAQEVMADAETEIDFDEF